MRDFLRFVFTDPISAALAVFAAGFFVTEVLMLLILRK